MPALSGWTFLNMEHAVKLRAYVGCFLVKPGLQNNTTSPNSGVIPHPAKCTGLSLEGPQPNPSPTNNETNKTAKPKLMSLPFGAMDDIRVLSRIQSFVNCVMMRNICCDKMVWWVFLFMASPINIPAWH